MTKFLRAGMALFNVERVICIEQRKNRVVFVFDTDFKPTHWFRWPDEPYNRNSENQTK